MGKSKNVASVETENDETMDVSQASGDLEKPTTEKDEYEALCSAVNTIAHPLATRKLAKKVYKLIGKAAGSSNKTNLRQGLADVHKAIRKGETGLMVLAGNVSPIDIYSHLPALCEDKDLPYIFTPSREQLGLAARHRRAAIVLLVKPEASYQELYDEVRDLIAVEPPQE